MRCRAPPSPPASPPPTVHRGLGALTYGAAEVVFALVRVAGWLAHALEEYAGPIAPTPSPPARRGLGNEANRHAQARGVAAESTGAGSNR